MITKDLLEKTLHIDSSTPNDSIIEKVMCLVIIRNCTTDQMATIFKEASEYFKVLKEEKDGR